VSLPSHFGVGLCSGRRSAVDRAAVDPPTVGCRRCHLLQRVSALPGLPCWQCNWNEIRGGDLHFAASLPALSAGPAARASGWTAPVADVAQRNRLCTRCSGRLLCAAMRPRVRHSCGRCQKGSPHPRPTVGPRKHTAPPPRLVAVGGRNTSPTPFLDGSKGGWKAVTTSAKAHRRYQGEDACQEARARQRLQLHACAKQQAVLVTSVRCAVFRFPRALAGTCPQTTPCSA